MKITIEPTEHLRDPTVVISVPYDDITADEMIEFFKSLMAAQGFQARTIKEAFNEDN